MKDPRAKIDKEEGESYLYDHVNGVDWHIPSDEPSQDNEIEDWMN